MGFDSDMDIISRLAVVASGVAVVPSPGIAVVTPRVAVIASRSTVVASCNPQGGSYSIQVYSRSPEWQL